MNNNYNTRHPPITETVAAASSSSSSLVRQYRNVEGDTRNKERNDGDDSKPTHNSYNTNININTSTNNDRLGRHHHHHHRQNHQNHNHDHDNFPNQNQLQCRYKDNCYRLHQDGPEGCKYFHTRKEIKCSHPQYFATTDHNVGGVVVGGTEEGTRYDDPPAGRLYDERPQDTNRKRITDRNTHWTSPTLRSSHNHDTSNNHIYGRHNHHHRRPGETRPYDYHRQDPSHSIDQDTEYPPPYNQQQEQEQQQQQQQQQQHYQHTTWKSRAMEMKSSNDNYDRYQFAHHNNSNSNSNSNSNNNSNSNSNSNNADNNQRYFRNYSDTGRERTERKEEYKYGYDHNHIGTSDGGGDGDSAVEASAMLLPNNDHPRYYYSRDNNNNDQGGREKRRRRGSQDEYRFEHNNGDTDHDNDNNNASPRVAAALPKRAQRYHSCDHNTTIHHFFQNNNTTSEDDNDINNGFVILTREEKERKRNRRVIHDPRPCSKKGENNEGTFETSPPPSSFIPVTINHALMTKHTQIFIPHNFFCFFLKQPTKHIHCSKVPSHKSGASSYRASLRLNNGEILSLHHRCLKDKELIDWNDIDIDIDTTDAEKGRKVAIWLLLLNAFIHYKPDCTLDWINSQCFSQKKTNDDGVENRYMPLRIVGHQPVHMLFQRHREGCYIVFYNTQLAITHRYFLSNKNKKRGSDDLPRIDPRTTTMDTTKKIVPRANNEGAKKNHDDDTATSRQKNAAQKPKRTHSSSPFLINSLENRARIQKEHPTASYGEIARLVHAAFTKQKSKNERRTDHLEQQEKERYTTEMKDYKSLARYKYDEDEKGGKKEKKKRDPHAPKQATSSALIVPTPNDLIVTICRGRTVVVNDRLDTIFEEVRQLYNNNQSKQLEQTIKSRVLYSLRESIKKYKDQTMRILYRDVSSSNHCSLQFDELQGKEAEDFLFQAFMSYCLEDNRKPAESNDVSLVGGKNATTITGKSLTRNNNVKNSSTAFAAIPIPTTLSPTVIDLLDDDDNNDDNDDDDDDEEHPSCNITDNGTLDRNEDLVINRTKGKDVIDLFEDDEDEDDDEEEEDQNQLVVANACSRTHMPENKRVEIFDARKNQNKFVSSDNQFIVDNDEVSIIELLDDDDDDEGETEEEEEVIVVEQEKSIEWESEDGNNKHNDYGDIQIIGSTGKNAIADFAHPRGDCVNYPFENGPKSKLYCPKCYCYVCDVLVSECTKWDTHCQAIRSVSKWQSQRENQRSKRKRQEMTKQDKAKHALQKLNWLFKESEETIPPRRRTRRNVDYTQI